MTKILIASHNRHKVEEIQKILGQEFELISLEDLNDTDEILEDGSTLEENALKKAKTVYQRHGLPSLADDSGLEVEALGGAPGVYSARFAGSQKDSNDNINLLLDKLKGSINRKASFRTVIAYISNEGEELFEGIISGAILDERKGDSGFGYDPVFRPSGSDKSFAQMMPFEKNAISHRSRALEKFRAFLISNNS